MKYMEIREDLFNLPEDFQLVHCISVDAKMGAGIATEFVRRFPEIKDLRSMTKEFPFKIGECHWIDRTLSLITKQHYYGKPTYDTLTHALLSLRDMCIREHIDKIGMPLIGCGLDKLKWDKVRPIVHDVFKDVDIEIRVCIK